jgi:hypothetical protein
MKKTLLGLSAISAAVGVAAAAETDAARVELSAPLPRAAKDAPVRAVPIQNYWDSHSWDPIGGPVFWHDLSEKRRAAMSARHAQKNAPDNTGATKPNAR